MRVIKYLVVHCTATPQTAKIASIKNYWKNVLGWNNPGYHYIINPDGTFAQLQPEELPANGVAGYNSNSIHISYIGGVTTANVPIDNRTAEQKATMLRMLTGLKKKYPKAVIQGHRDFPKVAKACPSFNAREEYKNI